MALQEFIWRLELKYLIRKWEILLNRRKTLKHGAVLIKREVYRNTVM